MVAIRPEQPDDISVIHAVHAACFPTDAEARLVDVLREAGRLCVSTVAVVKGEVVGHVAFSPVTLQGEADGGTGVGLAPIAVNEAFRCQGIAASLVREGLGACRAAGYGWAVVLGDPHYYARFGFHPATSFGLYDEYGGGDAFQAMELVANSIPRNAGLVRYAPEFVMVG